MENKLDKIVSKVGSIIPKGTGFILLLFEFGDNIKNIDCSTNISKKSAVNVMKKFVDKHNEYGI